MINRNNYEEYLLMYIDGELSPSDARSVELFLEENPDIKEELKLLQQTILQPEETIRFADKASLYRKAEGISLGNYQEYFLLYIDNELTAPEKEAVETFVLQQPQLQDEFTLLKETVLPAEEIIFTGKASLYRKEEKRRPVVISLRWASLAAAVMTGIIVLTLFTRNDNNSNGTDPVAATPGNVPSPGNSTASADQSKNNTEDILPVITQPQEQENVPVTVTASVNNSGSNKKNVQPLQQVQVKEQQVRQEVIANNYRPQEQQTITIPVENPVTTPVTNPPVTTTASFEGGEKSFAANTPAADNRNNYTSNAVYTEELETEKDKTVYVGAMQVNPDKVRGFFRKATRFLSSKVKSSDDSDSKGKVKVANLEMNKIK